MLTLAGSLYAVGYFREERAQTSHSEGRAAVGIAQLRKYYCLTPLFVFSMMLVAVANNLGVMWVAIEATTLASVFLVTFYGRAHFPGGRMEVRDHRRRGAFHGVVRHDAGVLLRHRGCWAPDRFPA